MKETSERLKKGFLSNLSYDFPASIVVFLVALPLCLGIALASGAPLISGIIAGIVGGIVVGSLSGSPLGVSGPAAGLAVIVLSAIAELGAFEIFLAAVVLAGLMQVALGFLKAGVIGYYFPTSVIKGMLTGIGIIIFLKQIPIAFGLETGQGTYLDVFSAASPGAVVITLVSLAILILWERPFMKNIEALRYVQGPLVAVVVGLVLYLAFQGSEALALTQAQLVSLPEAGIGSLLTFPDLSALLSPQVWVVAATIAVVASIETLLSVEATDKLDPFKRTTPTNRELKAQGMGNVVSGLVGGLPVTQVIIRSSANIQSGGRTKASAIMHAFMLLASVLVIPFVLNMIPLASLAAVLFVVGYKLAKPAVFRQMWSQGWEQFVPFIVTVVGVVALDLLMGVGLGFAVAVCIVLYENWQLPFHFDPSTHKPGDDIVIQLAEHVSFFNKANLQHALNETPDRSHVVLDATRTIHVHPDVREVIENFRVNAKQRDITLEVRGSLDGKKHRAVEHLQDRLDATHEAFANDRAPHPQKGTPTNGASSEEHPSTTGSKPAA